jgi:hypothetical protein
MLRGIYASVGIAESLISQCPSRAITHEKGCVCVCCMCVCVWCACVCVCVGYVCVWYVCVVCVCVSVDVEAEVAVD